MIFKVGRTDECHYDEYDEVIVRARNAKEAKRIVLEARKEWCEDEPEFIGINEYNITVEQVPSAGHVGVIAASFNAG